MAAVFRWTGHFPEKTRSLVRDLAKRAEALKQVYPREAEDEASSAVTTLVASLAMNFVHRGAYFPEATAGAGRRRRRRRPRSERRIRRRARRRVERTCQPSQSLPSAEASRPEAS